MIAEDRPLGTPIVLALIAATHLANGPSAFLIGEPMYMTPLAVSLLLGIGYAGAAWLSRSRRMFAPAVGLVVGEDLAALAAGLAFGYPWAEHLRPAPIIIIALQLVLSFTEIERRQSAGLPLRPAILLAWFVVAYSVAFAVYTFAKPTGLWEVAGLRGVLGR